MSSREDEQIVATGANATITLDVVSTWVSKRTTAILKALESQMAEDGGRMDADHARSACFELLANKRLHTDLERAIDKGRRTASKIVQSVSADK